MTTPLFFTIDSPSTHDIDDAISITQQGGDFVVAVAITDPSGLVAVGSAEDLEALDLAATIYARERTVRPMLPRAVVSDCGSLVAGKEREALVFNMVLSEALDVVEFKPVSAVVTVSHRLSYNDIPRIIQGAQSPLRDALSLLSRLSTTLLQGRRAKGALALFDLSRLMLSDEEGNLLQYESQTEMIGHIIVQEMMILTNAQIAKYMAENGIPAIYRNHSCRVSAPSALDLANTVDQWLQAGAASPEIVGIKIDALIERAVYDNVARGHYGLCLPLYLHGTSPLRRYTDLVNVRQLRAHLGGQALPYDQSALGDIAKSINATLLKRSEDTVDYHKNALAEKAQRMIGRGHLASMEDNVLSAAVKLAITAGYLPDAVIEELIRRLENNSIADAIVDRIAIQIPRSAINPQLGSAFARWMHRNPPSVVRVLMNGVQTNVFKDLSINEASSNTGFNIVASVVRVSDGVRIEGCASDAKKRTAEQKAITEIFCKYLNLPAATPTDNEQCPAVTSSAPTANHKGALLELCQKRGWPLPAFKVQMSGASNTASFLATASLRLKGGQTYSASSQVTASKRTAEAAAAEELLKVITSRPAPSKGNGLPGEADNPVVTLQELAQKRKLDLPQYSFKQVSSAPPAFECKLILKLDSAMLTSEVTAPSKRAAKELAAKGVLDRIANSITLA